MEKEKTDKKDHILDVAERVFADHGFDGASTRLISGEAGVNMAMLNYYFGSKEGLFLSVIERKINNFRDILQNIGADGSMTAWDKVACYIDMYSAKVYANNCFQKLLYQELSMNRRTDLGDKLRNILMTNISELRRIIQDGVNAGEFKNDTDVEMVISTLYGTKNFIVNTPLMTQSLLGYDLSNDRVIEAELKPRIRTYMKNLLKCYLVNENEHNN